MFSILPDLTPRDSHNLWYTSSRSPAAFFNSDAALGPDGHSDGSNAPPNPNNSRQRSAQHLGALAIERSALGRLRDEERTHERRRANVGNLGSTWLKPPGVTKTLFQIREERREAEEHAEALRREMLAQELAEAEAQGAPVDMDGDGDGDGDEQMMMGEGDEEGGGGRDLDDDIPDADEGGFGFDGASDEDDDDDDDDDENEGRRQHPELANLQATEERMREMMVRRAGGGDLYGVEEDIDEDERGQMLEEDDLVSSMYPDEMEPGIDMDMGMDANLDDDIPEAEGGGYEHTDSEASLSSDEEVTHNTSFAGMRAPSLPHPRSSMGGPGPRSSMGGHGPRSSMAGGMGARNSFGPRSSFGAQRGPRDSLDLSSILSRDGSSVAGSSPRPQRRN
ncbi:hypothetical protein OQA88_11433 [Cercophora sp. LCS_1]